MVRALPVRLRPGDDLREALEAAVRRAGCAAAFVLSGVGSLAEAQVRFAGAKKASRLAGDLEILSLAGTISLDGSHLHVGLSTSAGDVLGGHAGVGCVVRTTAEVLLALLPEWRFGRAMDPATGYHELTMVPTSSGDGA